MGGIGGISFIKGENGMKHEVRVSVRNLVEFILRYGDIDQRMGAQQDVDAMQAGSKAHRKLSETGRELLSGGGQSEAENDGG